MEMLYSKRGGASSGLSLSFWAKADEERSIEAWVQQEVDPWDDHVWFGETPLATAWQEHELCATATGDDPLAGLYFGLGQTTGTVWLDDVRLQESSRQVWRRDYQGGLALVNATAGAAVVPLNGTFRKIRGTQVPGINDGSLVRQVALPAWDGMVLLRVQGVYEVRLPVVWKS